MSHDELTSYWRDLTRIADLGTALTLKPTDISFPGELDDAVCGCVRKYKNGRRSIDGTQDSPVDFSLLNK